MRTCLLLLAMAGLACKSTPDRREAAATSGEPVTIQPDELEPMRRFVLETRRVVAAEFVRIEMSTQFFEQQMGYTRDLRFVERKMWTLEDGTRVIELQNSNEEQVTNINPDLLPRVYFGNGGLEVRAFRAIRIYLRHSTDRDRPLYLRIQARSASDDARLWTSGRLEIEKPSFRIRTELLWSEQYEDYRHRSSVG